MAVAMETAIDLEALLIVKLHVLRENRENLSLKLIAALCLKVLEFVWHCFQRFISIQKLPNVKDLLMVAVVEMPIDLEALPIVKMPVPGKPQSKQ